MPTVKKLPIGKAPPDVLKRTILKHLGTPSERVIKGAEIGEDAPVIDMGDRVLVAKSNPVTGASKNIGRIAVHITANDVASRGAAPLWFSSVILVPEGSTDSELKKIAKEIHETCCDLGVQIIGGHTECVSGISKPIVVGFMLGETSKKRYLTTGGSNVGDMILLTKSAGLEGAGILASDLKEKLKRGVDKKTINEAIRNLDRLSVVPEALKAVETGYVSSLHTPTEGGVINGLLEMASAAKTGLLINEDGIPISPSTRKIAEALKLDPLRLLSSGALLLAVNRKHVSEVRAAISSIEVETSIIGEVRTLKEGRILLTKNGRKSIEPVEHDELYRILENC